jgi:NADPH:quinone reductase-like Zn-dependent oxidoreductase
VATKDRPGLAYGCTKGSLDRFWSALCRRGCLSETAAKRGCQLASSVYAADEEELARRGVEAANIGVQLDARRLEALSRMVDARELSVRLERVLPLEKAPEALEESRIGHVRGKILLFVD